MNTLYTLYVILALFTFMKRDAEIIVGAEEDVEFSDAKEGDIREMFRKKFGKSPLRGTNNVNNKSVIIIKRTEVLKGNAAKAVTEKEVNVKVQQAAKQQTRQMRDDAEYCNCFCPELNCPVNSKGGVTTLKIVQSEPEVLTSEDIKSMGKILPDSCAEAMKITPISRNGLYTINIPNHGPTEVYCFNDPFDGGCAWTVLYRRMGPGPFFNRPWQDYVNGFGKLDDNFFLGLDLIHGLTSGDEQEMCIFTNFQTNEIEKEGYSKFQIGDQKTNYQIQNLASNSQSSVVYRVKMNSKFSTSDRDNGKDGDKCAKHFGMGWWYSDHCKKAIGINGVRAYLTLPTKMGVRPLDC